MFQGREVIFDLISWRIHSFYQTHVSSAVKCRPVREIKDDPQVRVPIKNIRLLRTLLHSFSNCLICSVECRMTWNYFSQFWMIFIIHYKNYRSLHKNSICDDILIMYYQRSHLGKTLQTWHSHPCSDSVHTFPAPPSFSLRSSDSSLNTCYFTRRIFATRQLLGMCLMNNV